MEPNTEKFQAMRDAMAVRHPVRALIQLVFLLAGTGLCFFVSGCEFLGLVLLGIDLVIAVFDWLNIWEIWNPVAKKIRVGFSILLILVLIASLVTLVPILRGPAEGEGRSDFCIVLGAGVKGTEPSQILQNRIDMAYAYLTENPDAICIATGGKGSDEQISEAKCIYNHLTAMGIDGDRIWLEEQATSTIENFRYSIALIREKTGAVPETVTVLSNEFHLFRASVMADDCGLQADFVAAPTSDPLVRVSYTVREIFALWKYLLVGG